MNVPNGIFTERSGGTTTSKICDCLSSGLGRSQACESVGDPTRESPLGLELLLSFTVMIDVTRYLSKSVNSFLISLRDPVHRIVPVATAASGEFRLASAAKYRLSS